MNTPQQPNDDLSRFERAHDTSFYGASSDFSTRPRFPEFAYQDLRAHEWEDLKRMDSQPPRDLAGSSGPLKRLLHGSLILKTSAPKKLPPSSAVSQGLKRSAYLAKTDRCEIREGANSLEQQQGMEMELLKRSIAKIFDKFRVRVLVKGVNREGALIESHYIQNYQPTQTLLGLLQEFQAENQIYSKMDPRKFLVRFFEDYETGQPLEPDLTCHMSMFQISGRSVVEIILDLEQAQKIKYGENQEYIARYYNEKGEIKSFLLPTATKNYRLTPSIEQIRRSRNIKQLMSVENFTIENEFGRIQYMQPVNLTGLDLSEIIEIKQNSIRIFNKTNNLLNNGETLNAPAIITYYRFGVSTIQNIDEVTDEQKRRFIRYVEEWVKKNNLFDLYTYKFGGDLQIMINKFY